MGPTGQAERVASQRCLLHHPLQRSAICCNTAPPGASQRNLLQRSASCCIPAQSRLAAATQPAPTAAAAASAPLTAATGRNLPWNPSERCDGGRSASSTGHTCGTVVARCAVVVLPLGEQVSCTCCVCAQRSAAGYSSPPISALLHFGTALIAHTGLASYRPASPPGLGPPPVHICTGTECIPRPHLRRDWVHAQGPIRVATAALRDICLCATQV